MRTEVQAYGKKTVFLDFDEFDRIRARSPESVNQRISEDIVNRVRDLSRQDKEDISDRIDELEREWDIDRALMLVFAGLGSLFLGLGMRKNGKFLYVNAVQMSFLAAHAFFGWCPPVLVLRPLGFRSKNEIDIEKYALKTLRGDFDRTAV